MASDVITNTIDSAGAVVIPAPLRRRFGINAGDEVAFEPQSGAIVMKPARTEKISRKDLREPPAWLKQARERAKNSPLARMSEKEVGEYCEELAERGAKKRVAKADQKP